MEPSPNSPPQEGGSLGQGALAGSAWSDTVFKWLLIAAACTIPALLLALLVELTRSAWPALSRFGVDFIVSTTWDPVAGVFGAWPSIFGTLLTSFLALAMAVPLSLGVAIYLTEFAPQAIRRPIATVIELLAAIPSVVYGLWGIFVLIPFCTKYVFPFLEAHLGFLPFFQGPIYGPSVLAASLILTVMIVPFIMSVSREVLLAVPSGQREAALALGATRWEAVSTAIVPYAKSGIIGAVILGLGRALGETMAVTMLIGNRHEVAASLFAPGYSMAAVIANEFADAAGGPIHESALIYMALLLFGVTVLVNALARLLIWRVSRGRGGGMISRRALRRGKSRLMVALMGVAVLIAVLPLFLILGSLILEGASSLSFSFFTNRPAPVGETGGGVAHAILGTLMIVGTASLVGIPLGVAAGIYASEYRGTRLATVTRFVADVLNGTPSIVIGLLAWTWVVATQKHFSALAGSFALAMLMVPMVMRTTEELVRLVPDALREAALALGYTRWRTTLVVVLRTALPGIVTGSLLAVARIAGETAPLLFTALGSEYFSFDMDRPMAALPLVVYKYATGPYPEWHKLAWTASLVLIMVVLVLSIAARLATRQRFDRP